MYPIESLDDIWALEIGLGINPETRRPYRSSQLQIPDVEDNVGNVIFSMRQRPGRIEHSSPENQAG
jgi:hypothetical protein